MTTPTTILEWLATAEGVPMNPDGHYGLQCVDLVDQYAQDIFEVPWPQSIGGVNGAKELLDAAPDAFWIRTDNNPNDPNLHPSTGDVIVFGGSAINQWGHTAVCISADANGMWVMQQDGFAAPLVWADGNWYSNKPAHKVWLPYYSNGTGMISGWLTPRTNKLAQQDAPAPVAPAPVALAANQRKTGNDVVNIRTEPNTKAAIIGQIPPHTVQTFVGYVVGEMIQPYNVWYKGTDGYVWSGAFTEAKMTGLPNVTPLPPVVTPPVVKPPVVVPPTTPAKYTFAPTFDFVEVIPAAWNNFQVGNFPAAPTHAVIHQFGTPGVDTLNSVINTFTNNTLERVASSHFVVSGKRIIQMVDIDDRAYHAGSVGNSYIGIETDPAQDADTIASTKKLLAALNAKYGYTLTLTRHKDVPEAKTSCGSLIDLEKYKVFTPPTPGPEPDQDIREKIISDFQRWQREQYLNSK